MMRKESVLAFCIGLAFIAAPGNVRAESGSDKPQIKSSSNAEKKTGFLDQTTLTGDWDGARTAMFEKGGARLIVNYVMDFTGNVVGGIKKAGRQASDVFAGVNLDWGKWSKKLDGFSFQVSMIWRFGANLSTDAIGNQFQVQQNYGGEGIRLYDLWIKKSFDDGRYFIRLGRFSQGDDFLTDPIYSVYVNNAIDGNSKSVFYNSPISAYPFATWALMAYLNPVDEWYAKIGVYGADTRLFDSSSHGMSFGADFNEGFFIIAQTGYLLRQGKNDRGLSGKYSVGGYYDTGKFDVYGGSPGQQVTGVWGGYVMMDQMLYREGLSDRGLVLWMSAVVGPENTSMMPYFVDGGLVYKGLFPKRGSDKLAIGAAWGRFGAALERQQKAAGIVPQVYEIILELDYMVQLTKFFYITPDIQYIINPSGRGEINPRGDIPVSNALVLGLQSGLIF